MPRPIRSLWSVAVAVLAFGGLAIVGGTAIGGDVGPITAAYGFLMALCALYMLAGLAIRDRAWRRLSRPMPTTNRTDRLAGRRIF
jgi:hypothetical protein